MIIGIHQYSMSFAKSVTTTVSKGCNISLSQSPPQIHRSHGHHNNNKNNINIINNNKHKHKPKDSIFNDDDLKHITNQLNDPLTDTKEDEKTNINNNLNNLNNNIQMSPILTRSHSISDIQINMNKLSLKN
eukprot:348149_1